MAQITRFLQKTFAKDAPAVECGQIGSKAAGSPTTTKDYNTIQSLAQYDDGLWSITNNGNDPPRIEDINSLYFLMTSSLKYLYQSGVPEWITTEDYFTDDSVVLQSGKLYMSKADMVGGVSGADPSAGDRSKWVPIYDPDVVDIGPAIIGAGVATVSLLAQDTMGITGTAPIFRYYESDTTQGWELVAASNDFFIRTTNSTFSTITGLPFLINNNYTGTSTPAVEIGTVTWLGSITANLTVQDRISSIGASPALIMQDTGATTNKGNWAIYPTDTTNGYLAFTHFTDSGTLSGYPLRINSEYSSTSTPAVEIGAIAYGSGINASLSAQNVLGITGGNSRLYLQSTANTANSRLFRIYNVNDLIYFDWMNDSDGTTANSRALVIDDGYTSASTPAVRIGAVAIGSGSSTVSCLVQSRIGINGDSGALRFYAPSSTSGSRAWDFLNVNQTLSIRRLNDSFTAESARLIQLENGYASTSPLLRIGASTGADVQVNGDISTTGGFRAREIYDGTGSNYGDVYTALSPYLTSVYDSMDITGVWQAGSGYYWIKAFRTTSTTIRLLAYNNSGSSLFTLDLVSGSTSGTGLDPIYSLVHDGIQ